MNGQGQNVGTVEVDPADFGGKINKQLLHEVVLMYLANHRAGTHSTLRRGEVAGSTKKVFRQKGTGNARVGNKRTNKRRGGGTAKGPKPRDYEYHLPKKAVRAATRMAILEPAARQRSRHRRRPEVRRDQDETNGQRPQESATRRRRLAWSASRPAKSTTTRQSTCRHAISAAWPCRRHRLLTPTTCSSRSDLLLTRAALEELRKGSKRD